MLAIVLALLAAFGFGSAAVFARIGMQGIRPLPSTLISAIASFVPSVLLALAFAFSDIRSLPFIALPLFLGHGALTFLGGRAQNLLSINFIGAARSSPFTGSGALFAAIFAIIFLGERMHPLVGLGTVAVVVGLVLTGGDDLFTRNWSLDRRSLLGYLAGLGAAASYGGSNLVAKVLSQEFGSPLAVAAFGTFFGIVVLWPLAGREVLTGLKTATSGLGFVTLSGLASSLGVITLYFALTQADVVIIAPIASISPLVTLLMAYLFLYKLERVTLWVLLGTVLAVSGVALVVVGSTL